MRILFLESDSRQSRVVLRALEAEQFAVDLPPYARDSVELAIGTQYDAIIANLAFLNIGLLEKLRKRGIMTPILALCSSSSAEARCRAIDMGADDCLTKPFLLQELVSRLRALLRRPPVLIDRLQVGDLELDSVRRKVVRRKKSIQLTPKEFAILEYLMRNAGRPVTRTMLMEHVWNGRFEGLTNIVDVYINYLRSKIDRGFDTRLIQTAHGIGYMVADYSGHYSKAAAV
jgi:two-component system copper resistance phosphate regulon response regulator CusR